MVEKIIVYVIVAFALGFALWKIYRSVISKNANPCGSCSADCELRNIARGAGKGLHIKPEECEKKLPNGECGCS